MSEFVLPLSGDPTTMEADTRRRVAASIFCVDRNMMLSDLFVLL